MNEVIAATSGADWLVAGSALATVAIYLALGFFAGAQLLDARKTRRAESRPYIYVDFDMTTHPMIELVMQNSGRTAATDVSFVVVPPLVSAPNTGVVRVTFLDQTWVSLPPGKTVRSFLATGPEVFGGSMPLEYEITAKYTDAVTGALYQEQFRVDLRPYKDLHYVHKPTLKEVVDELKSLNATLSSWSSQGHLDVLVKDRDKHEAEQDARFHQQASAPDMGADGKPDDQTKASAMQRWMSLLRRRSSEPGRSD